MKGYQKARPSQLKQWQESEGNTRRKLVKQIKKKTIVRTMLFESEAGTQEIGFSRKGRERNNNTEGREDGWEGSTQSPPISWSFGGHNLLD